jgi:hypothetical protein
LGRSAPAPSTWKADVFPDAAQVLVVGSKSCVLETYEPDVRPAIESTDPDAVTIAV